MKVANARKKNIVPKDTKEHFSQAAKSCLALAELLGRIDRAYLTRCQEISPLQVTSPMTQRHCHSFCHAPFHNNNAVFVTGQHPLPQLENSLWSRQHLLQYNVIVGMGLIIRWEGGRKICCSHVLTANCRVQNSHTRRCKRGKHR